MARGTQHRKRRPQANARVAAATAAPAKPKRPQHAKWEDQLFFARLRVHAKWMFVFLAVVFAAGFVLFGVGSGSGIGDALQNFFQGIGGNGSSGGGSVSALLKKTVENPKDAAAWRQLATKDQQNGDLDEAISALTTYTGLKPHDSDALNELAGLYLQRATDWENVYQAQTAQQQALMPTSPFQPSSSSKLGKAFASVDNPIEKALQATTGTAANNAYTQVLTLLGERLDVYKKLGKLNPKDANTQYQLAQAAQDAGDSSTATAAYEKFLRLAPHDPLAADARKALKQLKGTSTTTGG